MTERRRQIANREDDNLLYDIAYADRAKHKDATYINVDILRQIAMLKKRGIISEH